MAARAKEVGKLAPMHPLCPRAILLPLPPAGQNGIPPGGGGGRGVEDVYVPR